MANLFFVSGMYLIPFLVGFGGLHRTIGPGEARNLGHAPSGSIRTISPRAFGVFAQIGSVRSPSRIRLA